MHTDIVNTDYSEHWRGVKLADMAAIVKKSPIFWLWKSGNPICTLLKIVTLTGQVDECRLHNRGNIVLCYVTKLYDVMATSLFVAKDANAYKLQSKKIKN